MKKIILSMILLVVLACGKSDKDEIKLNLKGELPKAGEVHVDVYGYDKLLADHKATLILIHREKMGNEITIELPEDAESYIDPEVKNPEGASYYMNIEIVDGENTYTQDYDKNPFLEIEKTGIIDVYMKKK